MDIYSNQRDTLIHPAALAVLFVLILVVLLSKRERAGLAIAVLVCFIPTEQRIVVANIDFSLLRLLIVAAWARLILKRELRAIRLNSVDAVVLIWGVASILFHTWQRLTIAALVNRLGGAFDAWGLYFFYRSVMRQRSDVTKVVADFALVSIPVAIFFLVESRSGVNPFSIFGGVPEMSGVRGGRVRVQGPFSHPIIAGCFWASLVPLAVVEAMDLRGQRGRAIFQAGTVAMVSAVFLTASSTPVLSLGFGVVGGLFFIVRHRMRAVQMGIVLMLVALGFAMDAPVYHLISRVDVAGGSTGWHRFNLIHQFVLHRGEWWRNGTANIDHWNVFGNDVTNHFVAEAINGGIVTLALFVMMLVFSFRAIGLSLKAESDVAHQAKDWAAGVTLFIHVMNFIAVSYFGQSNVVLFLSLALAGSIRQLSESAQQSHPQRTTIVGRGLS